MFYYRIRVTLILFLIFLSLPNGNILAQGKSQEIDEINSTKVNDAVYKQKLFNAFNNFIKVKKFKLIESSIRNGDSFESVFEFVYPNKYKLNDFRLQKGKEILTDYIVIGNTLFNKRQDVWTKTFDQSERDMIIDALKFRHKLNEFAFIQENLKNVSFVVKQIESDKSEERVEILEYEMRTGMLPTKGKVWIKDGLPLKQEYETLPGCLNDIKGEKIFDYDSDVKITNPLTKK